MRFLIGSVLLIVLVFYVVLFVFCVLYCPSSIYDFLFSLRYVHTFLVYVWFVPSVCSYFSCLCLVCPFGIFILFLSMSGLSLRYLHSFLGYVWFVPFVSLTTFLIDRKCCYAVTDIRSNLCV